MTSLAPRKYVVISAILHVALLLVLILGVNFSSPLAVFENTNKNDVISAVVLGDTNKSKILPNEPKPEPQQVAKAEPKKEIKPEPEKTQAKLVQAKPLEQIKKTEAPVKKDVIAIKKIDKKKLAEEKKLAAKKQQELFAKDLLADIKKITDKHKKLSQKQTKSQFEKKLREQAEKSLREQLLNEDIKLKGMQTRQAQGEVNKYKALILQTISEHWIVPIGANKSLYCELMIRVAPGGMVMDVQVTKSSGDPSLDSSARAAVFKASPLPVPDDTSAFEPFRQFVLKVKPENVLATGPQLSPG